MMNKSVYELMEKEPVYFYRVFEAMTTFTIAGKSFSHNEDFRDPNLILARESALSYYEDRLAGIIGRGNFYGLPFASSDSFEEGLNAAYSISVSLVEYYDDELLIEHTIIGDDGESEGRETEALLLENLGYSPIESIEN